MIQKSALSLITLAVLATTAQAKKCFNAQDIDVTWKAYKTLAKIGVGGNFSQTKLEIKNTNTSTLKELLLDAEVKTNLSFLDAHLALKNNNIATFFTALLSAKNVQAKVIAVHKTSIDVSITLNNQTRTIPMAYSTEDGVIKATGVIDAIDYALVPALGILNSKVAGHLNKGWNDISIGFTLPYTKKCQ